VLSALSACQSSVDFKNCFGGSKLLWICWILTSGCCQIVVVTSASVKVGECRRMWPWFSCCRRKLTIQQLQNCGKLKIWDFYVFLCCRNVESPIIRVVEIFLLSWGRVATVWDSLWRIQSLTGGHLRVSDWSHCCLRITQSSNNDWWSVFHVDANSCILFLLP